MRPAQVLTLSAGGAVLLLLAGVVLWATGSAPLGPVLALVGVLDLFALGLVARTCRRQGRL